MSGVPLQVPPLSFLLFTDASLTCWGAHLLDLPAAGVWPQEEKELHINILEMKVVVLALNTLNSATGESVVLISDNATVAYLKKRGGTVSKMLCDLAQEVILWTELHSGTLTARYIPREKSILGDQLSRPDQVLPMEWSLLPRVFYVIC